MLEDKRQSLADSRHNCSQKQKLCSRVANSNEGKSSATRREERFQEGPLSLTAIFSNQVHAHERLPRSPAAAVAGLAAAKGEKAAEVGWRGRRGRRQLRWTRAARGLSGFRRPRLTGRRGRRRSPAQMSNAREDANLSMSGGGEALRGSGGRQTGNGDRFFLFFWGEGNRRSEPARALPGRACGSPSTASFFLLHFSAGGFWVAVKSGVVSSRIEAQSRLSGTQFMLFLTLPGATWVWLLEGRVCSTWAGECNLSFTRGRGGVGWRGHSSSGLLSRLEICGAVNSRGSIVKQLELIKRCVSKYGE